MKYLLLLPLLFCSCKPKPYKFPACYEVPAENKEDKRAFLLNCASTNPELEDAIWYLRECEKMSIKEYGILYNPHDKYDWGVECTQKQIRWLNRKGIR